MFGVTMDDVMNVSNIGPSISWQDFCFGFETFINDNIKCDFGDDGYFYIDVTNCKKYKSMKKYKELSRFLYEYLRDALGIPMKQLEEYKGEKPIYNTHIDESNIEDIGGSKYIWFTGYHKATNDYYDGVNFSDLYNNGIISGNKWKEEALLDS